MSDTVPCLGSFRDHHDHPDERPDVEMSPREIACVTACLLALAAVASGVGLLLGWVLWG